MIAPQKTAFNNGEVSPSVWPRTDLDKYKSSLRTARNFICHPQGGASNRCGMEYIASTKYATYSSASISQEFIFSQTQAYVLEFGHLYVRFYTDDMQLQTSGQAYEVATPYVHTDLQNLRFESSADVITITHPSYETRTLSRYAEKDWRLALYQPDDGPFMPENIDETESLSVSAVSGTNVTLTLSAVTTIDTNIVLLLHGDGIDASTTITDSSNRHTVTAVGNAQIDTANKVFGTGSILFDGSGDYLSIADSADWNFGTGDFTIECRLYPVNLASGFFVVSQYNPADTANVMYLAVDSTGAVFFNVTIGGVAKANYFTNAGVITSGVFQDLSLVRSGSSIFIFVNGISQTLNVSQAVGSNDLGDIGQPLTIGGINGAQYLNGWIDEFMITKSQGLYTADYTISNAPFSTTTVSATSSFSFDPLHVGALFKLKHYVQGQTISQAFTGTGTSSSISCFTTWRIITHGTWAAKFNIEKSIDGGTTWTVLRSFSSSSDFNANTSGTEDIDTNPIPFLIRINAYSFTSGTLNVDLTSDPFYQAGIVRTTLWNSAISMQADVLQQVGSASPTTTWAEGSWSDFRGYPSISRYYQDRLDLASTPSEPETDWLSKTSNYTSFVRNSPLLDTDGITVNLPSRQLNAINGLVAFKKLLAFTSSSVWSIGPISTTALTPTSVQQDIEEYSGSSGLNPVVLGTEAIYIDTAGEIVKSIGYQIANDGFVGEEVNVLAKHMFEGYTITKIAYQRSPNGIVWFRRSDGLMLSLTYLREQNVVAFCTHETDGDIEDFCVIPGTYSDELWLIVNRDGGKFVEKMIGRKQHDLTNHVFLDSYVHYDNLTTSPVSLPNLAGKVVSLIGDSVDLGTMTVSALGTLSISSHYTSLDIGLSFNADIETLSIDVPLSDGISSNNQIKIGNVGIGLINTRGGYIGPDENTLYEALSYDALNRANLINNKVALGTTENFTGVIRVPLGSGYETGGRFFLRQSRPFPITVSSLTPEINIGGKIS